ncbi:MAG: acetyl-CoA C-acyltransferase [Cyclobacteriaceae bacterium]
MKNEVYIVSAARTPIGSFGGSLSSISAVELGSFAIKGAIEKSKVPLEAIDEVYMGNVLSANLGQAPARQAALNAGLGHHIPCTTINKVCSSGLKAIMLAAQSILCGHQQIMIAGGMESMSNVPYYLPKARFGYKFGNGTLVDGLAKDGLHEVYYDFPMGNCAENTSKHHQISREEQDEYAISSYKKAGIAWEKGWFEKEIVPVEVKDKKGNSTIIREDEEFQRVDFDKIPFLKPVFLKEGTVTAANASTINDGAAAVLLMSKEKARELGVKPLAVIKGFADAAQDPVWFTTAPSLAIPKALRQAEMDIGDVDFFEINEAFSVVAIANQRALSIPMEKLNVFGGAVALGHPLGCSGARILTTLCSVLKKNKGKFGVAGICNGGGGASAMVIEML